jgi:hypothetical protein
LNILFDQNGIWKLDDYIMLDVENIDRAIEYVLSKFPQVDKIGIASNTNGVYEINLDFLKQFPNITHFKLFCFLAKSTDIQPIYYLKELQWLQWWSDNKVDISKFPKLNTLVCHYSDNIIFNNNNLSFLYLSYANKLSFLDKIPNLTRLELRNYSGIDLSGINHLSNLDELTIRLARKLIDIKDILECKNLCEIEFEGINKQVYLSILSKCENLKGLYLHMSIPNCLFLKEMKNIESFVCKEIEDNNLSPIFESTTLSYVYLYKYKRTYNYNKKDFEKRFPIK